MRRSVRIQPGRKGAKKLQAIYGNKLVCVRYRYDAIKKRRYKTVELIIEESDWQPKRKAIGDDEVVGVRVGLQETGMQGRIKKVGGKWNREQRIWELKYAQAKKLGIENRIIKNQSLPIDKPESLSISKPKSLR